MTADMDSGIHKVFSFSGVEEHQVKNNISFSVLVYPSNCGIRRRNISNLMYI